MRPLIVMLVLLTLGVVAWSVYEEDEAVARYCSYGGVSVAQLEQCNRDVSSDDFEDSETNAAAYGKGYLTACLDDAGPYCEGPRLPSGRPSPVDEADGWIIGG